MGLDAKEYTISLLSSTVVAMGTDNTKADLYTVPVGKSCIVTRVIIHSLDGAVALGSDFDFGIGSPAAGWKDTVNLSTVDDTGDYFIIVPTENTRIEAVYVAADVFGIQTDVSSDGNAVNATVDVFGYIF